MVGSGGGALSIEIMATNIIICIAALWIVRIQALDDTTCNAAGDLVLDSSKLVAKWVANLKLFVNAYSGLKTKGSELFGFVFLFGFYLYSYVIITHLNSNHKAWVRTSISGMAILSAVGVFLLMMVIPEDYAWHNTVVEAIGIFLLSLEACLVVRSKINEDVYSQNLLLDLLIKLVDTLITSYRFVDSKGKTHSPWDAEKILHLVRSGLPVLIGACQIGWIVYKEGIISKVVEWLMKVPRVFARKTEQAAGATMGGNGGRDAGVQVADEGVEVGNGLPVTTGASQVGWTAYAAGMKFKVIKWFRKTSRVSSAEDEQAAGAAMGNNGGSDLGQQPAEEDVQVVVD